MCPRWTPARGELSRAGRVEMRGSRGRDLDLLGSKEGERESASCSEKKLCSEGRRVTRVEHVFDLVVFFFFNMGETEMWL